jgi:hypothetical protein
MAGVVLVFILGGMLGAYIHSLLRPTDLTETTPLPSRALSVTCPACGTRIAYRPPQDAA